MGEKVAGTHITIRMEGDRERFCDANEGFLITADCQETVMSVEAWTMVAGDLRSVRAGGIPHISSGKCLAASTGDFGPLLSSGYSLSHNLFISTVFFPKNLSHILKSNLERNSVRMRSWLSVGQLGVAR